MGGRHSPAKLPVGIQPSKVLERPCVSFCVCWDDQVVKSKCSEAHRYTPCQPQAGQALGAFRRFPVCKNNSVTINFMELWTGCYEN